MTISNKEAIVDILELEGCYGEELSYCYGYFSCFSDLCSESTELLNELLPNLVKPLPVNVYLNSSNVYRVLGNEVTHLADY